MNLHVLHSNLMVTHTKLPSQLCNVFLAFSIIEMFPLKGDTLGQGQVDRQLVSYQLGRIVATAGPRRQPFLGYNK